MTPSKLIGWILIGVVLFGLWYISVKIDLLRTEIMEYQDSVSDVVSSETNEIRNLILYPEKHEEARKRDEWIQGIVDEVLNETLR